MLRAPLLVNLVALLLSVSTSSSRKLAEPQARAPIILVPGLGGSVLETRLHDANEPHYICPTNHDWEVEWVTPGTVSLIDCLLNNLELHYDATTHRYSNQTGVEVRPYKFGKLEGIAALDPEIPDSTGTYADLISALADIGYREGTDLFGAPYDFRLAADGLEQVGWYGDFQRLVEGAVAKNNGRPAIIISHSMGGLVTYYFLTKVSKDGEAQIEDWTRRHVAGFIPIAAPWEGAVTALKGQISGDPFDLPLPHALLRPVQKTSPSGPWLFPRVELWKDTVFVETTGGDSYTAADSARLLADLNLTQQAAIWPRIRNLIQPLQPLSVPVHCLYGADQDTEEGYVYDVDHFSAKITPAPYHTRHGPGDGTVNLRSLQACEKLGPHVQQHVLPNVTHLGILMDDAAIRLVVKLVEQLAEDHAGPGHYNVLGAAKTVAFTIF